MSHFLSLNMQLFIYDSFMRKTKNNSIYRFDVDFQLCNTEFTERCSATQNYVRSSFMRNRICLPLKSPWSWWIRVTQFSFLCCILYTVFWSFLFFFAMTLFLTFFFFFFIFLLFVNVMRFKQLSNLCFNNSKYVEFLPYHFYYQLKHKSTQIWNK